MENRYHERNGKHSGCLIIGVLSHDCRDAYRSQACPSRPATPQPPHGRRPLDAGGGCCLRCIRQSLVMRPANGPVRAHLPTCHRAMGKRPTHPGLLADIPGIAQVAEPLNGFLSHPVFPISIQSLMMRPSRLGRRRSRIAELSIGSLTQALPNSEQCLRARR